MMNTHTILVAEGFKVLEGTYWRNAIDSWLAGLRREDPKVLNHPTIQFGYTLLRLNKEEGVYEAEWLGGDFHDDEDVPMQASGDSLFVTAAEQEVAEGLRRLSRENNIRSLTITFPQKPGYAVSEVTLFKTHQSSEYCCKLVIWAGAGSFQADLPMGILEDIRD